MKYIDAEKLIAEIERLKQKNEISDDKEYAPYELDVACGYNTACDDIISFITTLKQEPRFPQCNNIVEKVFGMGNLEGFEYREAEMLVTLAKEELLKSLQQEQLGVDFETEYAKFSNDPDALDYAFPIDLADYKDFARHFYELGLKARKV